MDFYHQSINDTLKTLGVNPAAGLTAQEAAKRLETNGPNCLRGAARKPLFLRILAQFKDFLVIILLIAAVVSVFAGDGLKDAILIVGILLVNVIISITQENRADNALAALKGMSAPKAKVRRNGQTEKIDARDVVPGDIILLEAGDYIPADIRLVESVNLKIDESALTGESMPVAKHAKAVENINANLGDRVNLGFMGTIVTYGRGIGVVYATGMDTEMGKIATLLNETDEAATPLQDKLNAMAKVLGIVCIVTCAIIFAVGLLRGMGVMEMFMVSVSLAVAAVPEGIAIVATVILAIGVQKMVRSHVIVKKLRAVETLGSTTVICSDKTGTLTQNKMTVVKAFDTAASYNVAEEAADLGVNPNILRMTEIAMLCNDAEYDPKTGKTIGDPTESALLVFGAKIGLSKGALAAKHKRVQEIPFDSGRKLMSTFNRESALANLPGAAQGDKIIMNTKGAPDAIIHRSSHVYVNGEILPMTEDMRRELTAQNEAFAARALRVLGFAFKEYPSEKAVNISGEDPERRLVYVGMMGMIDPPREGVKASVDCCRAAGINVKMITGDHKTTAAAIATSLGIMAAGDEALDGGDLNQLSAAGLAEKVKTVNVFARVSPEHKVRIVEAVQAGGNIVAMTGDGVNDAPSLKKADIGIAMGMAGTDVSKEAADMILTDDNFVSIVGAVEQGRTIYGNIRKVTAYLLACNIGEILIILGAIVFGLPVPLAATQLLFVNLLTDAFPAFALGMEGKEPGIMAKPPRDPKEPIINKGMRKSVAFRAVFLAAGTLGAFLYGLRFHDYAVAISMCFFTLVATELLVAYSAKSEGRIGGRRLFNKLFANRFLNISMGLSLVVLVAVMYVPGLNTLFSAVPLSPVQFAVCAGFITIILAAGEVAKIFLPERQHYEQM